jgi:hypothetical protein
MFFCTDFLQTILNPSSLRIHNIFKREPSNPNMKPEKETPEKEKLTLDIELIDKTYFFYYE